MPSKVRAPDPYADGVVFVPTEAHIENANVTRFMREHGIETLEELLERSRSDVAWFWGAVEEHLGFEWFEPYEQVLDESQGIAWAKWYVGGRTNIALNCLDRWARNTPDARALVWEGEDGAVETWSYQDLYEETNRLAGALVDMGVGEGVAVGVYLPMVPQTVASLLAIAKLGAIFVPLFSGFGADAIVTRLEDAEAKVLITADGFLRRGSKVLMKPTADEAAARVPSLERMIVVERLGVEVHMDAARDITWDEATAGKAPERASVPVDSEHPWMIIYTSGTTGKPKGSVHVHGGFLVKICQEAAHQCDVQQDDLLFWFSDMGWIMGPWEVVGALGLGAAVMLYEGSPDHPDPGRLWHLVERHGVTQLGVSPTLIRALIPHGDAWIEDRDLSSLKAIGSTGEPWNPEPYLWLYEKAGRVPIINLSGGTEVGACFLSPLPITPLKPTSLGHPSLGMAAEVLDPDGNPVPPGTVGELACTRPWPGMTRGLWKAPERYLETYWSRWKDVWFHGDFASVDEDGFWYLHGRSDDVIKIAGKRVGPAEVESVLVDTGLVTEAAAVGVPDEVKGETVHAWVILRPDVEDSEATVERLRAAVAEALGKPFKPAGVHIVPDLPRTRNGKILRRGVKAKALGRDPGDLSSIGNPEALEGIEPVG